MNRKNKRVGFIARGLTKGGVTRFVSTTLSELDKQREVDFFIFTDDESFEKKYKNLKVVYIKNKNKLIWDYISSLVSMRKFDLDVVFYTKNIIPITHLFLRCKKMNIIYDLAYFIKDLNAYRFWDSLYMKSFMRLSCMISDRIISISENTKNDLVNILGVKREKICVVYLAADNSFREKAQRSTPQETTPFLFYSGSVSPRKNLLRVVKAFDEIKDNINHDLYITGRDFWNSEDLMAFIEERKALKSRIKFLGFLTEEELVDYYNNASLYLFPSLYEGFGLPILEAQACGCPVLTSNVSSCTEVAENSAHIVDPYSTEEIRDGILKIIDDDEYRKELIRKGRINVKRFSWEKTAINILKLIKEL